LVFGAIGLSLKDGRAEQPCRTSEIGRILEHGSKMEQLEPKNFTPERTKMKKSCFAATKSKFKHGPSKVYDWALLGPSLIIYCKSWIYP